MAAQLEEVVVDADPADPQELLPEPGHGALQLGRRRDVGGARAGPGMPRSRRGRGQLHRSLRRAGLVQGGRPAGGPLRTGADPVPLPLEGIGRAAAPGGAARRRGSPPSRCGAGEPEPAEGAEQHGAVRLLLPGAAQRGDDDPVAAGAAGAAGPGCPAPAPARPPAAPAPARATARRARRRSAPAAQVAHPVAPDRSPPRR